MSVSERYAEVKRRADEAAKRCGRDPADVKLIAVTKTHPASEINEAIDAGATDIGENRVQEVLEKYEDVKPVNWHLIGHLQTNKVRQIIDKVVMIHSVDSLKLAHEINSAMEETKSGISASELKQLCEEITADCGNVRICGLMCIPPIAAEPEDARPYFKEAASLFSEMKKWDLPAERFAPTELSMGMSGDFEVAIEEGSTMVRVGSSIFGPRNYR